MAAATTLERLRAGGRSRGNGRSRPSRGACAVCRSRTSIQVASADGSYVQSLQADESAYVWPRGQCFTAALATSRTRVRNVGTAAWRRRRRCATSTGGRARGNGLWWVRAACAVCRQSDVNPKSIRLTARRRARANAGTSTRASDTWRARTLSVHVAELPSDSLRVTRDRRLGRESAPRAPHPRHEQQPGYHRIETPPLDGDLVGTRRPAPRRRGRWHVASTAAKSETPNGRACVQSPQRAGVGPPGVLADGGLDQAARGLCRAADLGLFGVGPGGRIIHVKGN